MSSDTASNAKAEQRESPPVFKRKARHYRPTYFDTIRWDPLLHQPLAWREAQLRDQARWSRKYLLPSVRFLCLSLIVITRMIKRILPFKIYSWRALNFLSQWFVKRCMSAEAQEMLLRHFATEAVVVNFIAQNTRGEAVEDVGLFPLKPEELGEWGGMNATLLHDCNIMNLFIDLGKSKKTNVTTKRKKADIDFSALALPEFQIDPDPSSRLMNLDMETSLYIMVLFLVFLFDEDVTESAANSLKLDESVLTILANLTGDNQFRHWSNYPFTNLVRWPNDAPRALHEHMLIFEYTYVRLCLFRDGKKNPADANI